MIVVPFIYFTLLTFYLWKRHRCFDVCVYMSALYAFTAFLSNVLVFGNMLEFGGVLFDNYDLELSVIPTVLYCAVITAGIMPFSMLYKNEIKKIETPNPTIIYALSWFLIAISLLNFYLVADSTIEILSGDLSSVRSDHYNGIESPAEVKAQSLPSIIGYIYYFNLSTLLALPLFFYYICYEKRKWWFNLLVLFASLSVPLAGIQAADRTEIVFYAMMFLSCLIMFRKKLPTKVKRIMRISMIPVILLVITYIVAVSQARFAKEDGGAETSVAQYAGQNYLNFCYFWENGKWEYLATEREFPLINHLFFKTESTPDRRTDRSGKQGFFISVFASYAGDVMLDLSPIGLFIWACLFFIVTVCVLKRPHRDTYSVGEYMAFFALSVIPIFGIFYYRYHAFTYSFLLLLVAACYVSDKYKIKI